MPPKKAPAPSKKAEVKKKEKIIEDKTFGMKNKKGGKAQKYIAQVEKQVKSGGHHPQDKEAEKKRLEKEKKLQEQKEMALLFKPVQTQSVAAGTDPKSVVCAFFKQGNCGKGNKCKFSHDLSVERKTEKRSIYCDMRDVEADGETMENWSEDKLNEVVNKKHGGKEKTMPTTTIICKYFLDAVEKRLYGWFWECPNGEKCIYRHALPQGYVLKRDQKKDDKKDQISLDELIESERAKLSGVNQTRVTLETFLAWKKRKIQERKDAAKKDEDKKRKDFSAGRSLGLSGREMFSFNPELANDGDMEDGDVAIDSYAYNQDEEDANVQYKELDLNALSVAGLEVDGTGTVAESDRLEKMKQAAGTETKTEEEASKDQVDATPFNENLFLEEDLEGLDDELNDLDLNDAS
ncbi:zinc finger CCCH domain-containing protein 15 homolog [Culicoides brevitarsis]|uniref:zinc finger CCCH domain-containing protein 15 homolog n=1 Tax=Culicoides brevitarsis TaxID=469753 RepID=UPI00307B4E35